MFFELPCVIVADTSSLGRIDYATMSQQALMEMMFAKVSLSGSFQNGEGNINDISDLETVKVNSDGKVTEIDFTSENIHGVNLTWAPRSLKTLRVGCCKLECTIETRMLPPLLSTLVIKENSMIGPFDVSSLPERIESVDARMNEFDGSIVIGKTLSMLNHLDLQENKFSGSVLFEDFPESLEYIDFSSNNLHGTVTWEGFPNSLDYIALAGNQFSGTIDLTKLPEALEFLYLYENKFTGTLDFSSMPMDTRVVMISDNLLTGSLNLRYLTSPFELDLTNNNFKGEVVMPVPTDDFTIMLTENEITNVVDLNGETVQHKCVEY